MSTMVSTMRCEVVKPLDGDWKDLGRTLRALRTPLHRVLNGVITQLELRHARSEAPDKWAAFADDHRLSDHQRAQLLAILADDAAKRVGARQQGSSTRKASMQTTND